MTAQRGGGQCRFLERQILAPEDQQHEAAARKPEDAVVKDPAFDLVIAISVGIKNAVFVMVIAHDPPARLPALLQGRGKRSSNLINLVHPRTRTTHRDLRQERHERTPTTPTLEPLQPAHPRPLTHPLR